LISKIMDGFVYIIYSEKNDKYYVGSTINIDNRLNEHNSGRNKSTRSGIPWEIKFYFRCGAVRTARQIEHKIKKKKSRKILEQIIKDQEIKMNL